MGESRPQGGMNRGARVPGPVECLTGIVGCGELPHHRPNIVPPLQRDGRVASATPVMDIYALIVRDRLLEVT